MAKGLKQALISSIGCVFPEFRMSYSLVEERTLVVVHECRPLANDKPVWFVSTWDTAVLSRGWDILGFEKGFIYYLCSPFWSLAAAATHTHAFPTVPLSVQRGRWTHLVWSTPRRTFRTVAVHSTARLTASVTELTLDARSSSS